jgi:hypothetical protein
MKKPVVIASTAFILLALTSCGDITKEDGSKSVMSDETYTLSDGRQVTCMVGTGRLSCDWDNAR